MRVPVLRQLSLGEVLDTSLGIYRQLFSPLVIISILTQSLPLALGVYVEAAGGVMQQPALWTLSLGLSLVLGSVGTAASTFIVANAYVGTAITWQDAFLRSTPFMGRLIGTSMLVSLLVGLGLLALLVPGLILLCGLVLTPPALVLEDLPGGVPAMARSWALSRGFRWRILAALLVAFVLLLIPAIALGSIAGIGAVADLSEETFTLLAMIITAMLQVLVYPYFYVLTTVLYYDLRVRKEGLDLEMLASGLLRVQ
jgi:hypothetical protein